MDAAELRALIRDIPDFPHAGILFRDITPLLKDKRAFAGAVDLMCEGLAAQRIDHVVAIEARGYLLGAPMAYRLGAGLIPVRKPGKLPFQRLTADYALEYGTNSLEIHNDAVSPGERVVIVDDLLATGGTAAATKSLLEQLGAAIVGVSFLVELTALHGREKLAGTPVSAVIDY